jgi:ubiquinone/menaquinone biosynthesis C-methylase UbiE
MIPMKPNWQDSPKRSHTEVIEELLEPANAKIIDVGCGAGQITRTLTEMGAEVIGIDPGKRQLERARAAETVGNEIYIEGTAEDLPFEDEAMDIILFFNSFHHVPRKEFTRAIKESQRVLRPGGKLFFTEPIAEGPQFELSRLINDETEIRALAYESILSLPDKGFRAILEVMYITETRHKNFERFRFNSTSINPERERIFEKHNIEIRERFENFSTKDQGYFVFQHPIRGNLFERL